MFSFTRSFVMGRWWWGRSLVVGPLWWTLIPWCGWFVFGCSFVSVCQVIISFVVRMVYYVMFHSPWLFRSILIVFYGSVLCFHDGFAFITVPFVLFI